MMGVIGKSFALNNPEITSKMYPIFYFRDVIPVAIEIRRAPKKDMVGMKSGST